MFSCREFLSLKARGILLWRQIEDAVAGTHHLIEEIDSARLKYVNREIDHQVHHQ
jgi:hypothetical protein